MLHRVSSFLVFCVLVLSSARAESEEGLAPIVTLSTGEATGSFETTSWTSKRYISYTDIQYATATAFEPPVAATEFNNSGSKPICYATGYSSYSEDILSPSDCLCLTVHTKSLEEKKPVLVYVAGYDIYNDGSSTIEALPFFFLEHDVVLVTVQHRMGGHGFLSNLSEKIPGNAGILDVILALKWVKEHISKFGGDPEKVTITGQHHSSAIVHVLTMTPLLEDEPLFHQVIYMSGSAFMDEIVIENPTEMYNEVAGYLGCETEQCVIEMPLLNISEALGQYKEKHGYVPFLTVGGPSGVLPSSPKELCEEEKVRSYPTLGGVVKHPGIYYLENIGKKTNTGKEEFKENLSKMLSKLYDTFKSDDQKTYIKHMFPKRIFASLIVDALIPTLVDIKGFDIKYATVEAMKCNANSGSDSYLYTFNFKGEVSFLLKGEGQENRVTIGDENVYVFGKARISNNKEEKIAKFLTQLWASFVINGKPEASSLHDWPAMFKDLAGPYLKINTIHEIGYDFNDEFYVSLKDQEREYISSKDS